MLNNLSLTSFGVPYNLGSFWSKCMKCTRDSSSFSFIFLFLQVAAKDSVINFSVQDNYLDNCRITSRPNKTTYKVLCSKRPL